MNIPEDKAFHAKQESDQGRLDRRPSDPKHSASGVRGVQNLTLSDLWAAREALSMFIANVPIKDAGPLHERYDRITHEIGRRLEAL